MKRMMFFAAVLASLAARADLPKVIVMVDEKNLGTISTSEVESMAIEMLSEKGIETVDQTMVANNLERVQKALRGAGDNRAAAAMGREFGAEVVLIGEAVAKPNAAKIGDSNLRSYQASVTFRAIRVDNAVNIATASEKASVVAMDDVTGGSKALCEAGKKALKKVIDGLIRKWNGASISTGEAEKVNIELTVGGMDQIWKLKAMRQQLKKMKNSASSVTQKSYAQGAAVFNVVSLLPAEELAEELVMHPPEELKIQIIEIHPAAISLRVVDAPQDDDDDDDDE